MKGLPFWAGPFSSGGEIVGLAVLKHQIAALRQFQVDRALPALSLNPQGTAGIPAANRVGELEILLRFQLPQPAQAAAALGKRLQLGDFHLRIIGRNPVKPAMIGVLRGSIGDTDADNIIFRLGAPRAGA